MANPRPKPRTSGVVYPANGTEPDADGYPHYAALKKLNDAWSVSYSAELRSRSRTRRSRKALASAVRKKLADCLGLDLVERSERKAVGWDGESIRMNVWGPSLPTATAVLLLPNLGVRAATDVELFQRAGCIVAVPELPALVDFSDDHNAKRVMQGTCALGQLVDEAATALDQVAAMSGIERIWVAGSGLSATVAILLAALDRRCGGVIAQRPVPLGTVSDSYALAIPGFNRATDLDEIRAAIAPRPLYCGDSVAAWLKKRRPARIEQGLLTVRRSTRPRFAANSCRTLSAWKMNAAQLRRAFLDVNRIPSREQDCRPLAVTALGHRSLPDYTRFEFHVRTGEHAMAALAFLRPHGEPKRRPTVLCLPGSSSDLARVEREIAHEVVALGWNAAIIDARVALYPFFPGIAEDRALIAHSLHDLRCVLTAICERDDVDCKKIAAYGHSQGASHAWMLAAIDERIGAAVTNCGMTSYESLWQTEVRPGITALDSHSPYYYMPGILNLGEQYDLAALVAPRPLMVIGGDRDDCFPVSGMRACRREISRIYRLFGEAGNFRYVEFPGEHALPDFARDQAYSFLRQHWS